MENELLGNMMNANKILVVVLIWAFIFILAPYNIQAQSVKNAEYYQSMGYQVFPEYGFAIHADIDLENISDVAKGNFVLNLWGIQSPDSDEMVAYQLIIFKLSSESKNLSKPEIIDKAREEIIDKLERYSNIQPLFFSEKLYDGYMGEAIPNGKKQKALLFYRDGYIYTLTVISNYQLNYRFNTFTNSIKFFPIEHNILSNQSSNTIAHSNSSNYTYYYSSGFAIKKTYALKKNESYIEAVAKLKDPPKIIGAYNCAQNEELNDPNQINIINVNVTEQMNPAVALSEYKTALSSSGIRYSERTWNGLHGVEYTFEQDFGTVMLPTKAFWGYKETTYYLIQLGSLSDYISKFNELLNSIIIL